MSITIQELKDKFQKPKIDRMTDPQLFIDQCLADISAITDELETQRFIADFSRLALFKLLPITGDNVIVDVTSFDIGATHARVTRMQDPEYGSYIDIQPTTANGTVVDMQHAHVHTAACAHE